LLDLRAWWGFARSVEYSVTPIAQTVEDNPLAFIERTTDASGSTGSGTGARDPLCGVTITYGCADGGAHRGACRGANRDLLSGVDLLGELSARREVLIVLGHRLALGVDYGLGDAAAERKDAQGGQTGELIDHFYTPKMLCLSG
jgi:hypothetical protein